MKSLNAQSSLTEGKITDSSLEVRIATLPWEKREIYKLRYEVYIEEMGKPLPSKRKQLSDSLDDQSILLYVQSNNEIIGTSRITIAPMENFPPELIDTFHMHKFKACTDSSTPFFALGTKLAVKARYRKSTALFLLISETYRILREQNVPFFFGGCNPRLISLYERIGFRRFTRNFSDPGYGLLVPLVVVLEDNKYFQIIKSPLYRLARKYPHNSTISQRFRQEFPESSKFLNAQLIPEKKIWEDIRQRMGMFFYTCPVIKHLDEQNAMKFLLSGTVFSCEPGDHLIDQGSICDDLYILLSGCLAIESKVGSSVLSPGEVFGGLTLPYQQPYPETVSALTTSDVIVIPQQSFERYNQLNQDTAEIIRINLTHYHKIPVSKILLKKEV